MILVTGSEGFVARRLIDGLARLDPQPTLHPCDPRGGWDTEATAWELASRPECYSGVIHLGGISDTTCEDDSALLKNNVWQTGALFRFCAHRRIPFLNASSGSVYGNGGGPLNLYAKYKLSNDDYFSTLQRTKGAAPPHWWSLRFFNVYGPGEAHKGKQASVVSQMLADSRILFDIDATRDFVHVDDVVSVMLWLWKNRPTSGIYDVGTGVAEPFEAIPLAIAKATGKNIEIKRIPFPESLKGKYQMHTQADLTKLRAAGYSAPFMSLEDGVARMVSQ